MIEDAAASGVPFRWVGGDCVYGDSPTFVQGVRALGKWYVLDVSEHAHVWTEDPHPPKGETSGKGRPRTRPTKRPQPVPSLAQTLPESAWKRVVVAEGSQGPRMWEYAELKVWFSENRLPAAKPERLLIRRSLDQEPELKFQRCNAPERAPLAEAAAAGGCRWSIEQCFQTGKGECGLDEYETRGWIGWHHHTAMSMLALWFLTLQRRRLGEKNRTADGAGSASRTSNAADAKTLGRAGNPQMVELETDSQPDRRGMSSPAARRRTPAAR